MPLEKDETPIISVVGHSGAGKTTLLEKLIPELIRRGLKVGTLKHHAHGFEMDRPGKDSWRHKQAGAVVSIISSPYQIGMVMDVDHDYQPVELARFFPSVDIILAEGYKSGNCPKLEVYRPEVTREAPLYIDNRRIVALISDTPVESDISRFVTNDINGLADFLITRFNLEMPDRQEKTIL